MSSIDKIHIYIYMWNLVNFIKKLNSSYDSYSYIIILIFSTYVPSTLSIIHYSCFLFTQLFIFRYKTKKTEFEAYKKLTTRSLLCLKLAKLGSLTAFDKLLVCCL